VVYLWRQSGNDSLISLLHDWDARVASFRSRIFKGESHFDSRWTVLVVCVTTALSYLVPKLARLATPNPQTVWPIWPGCAILVAGLLLVRMSVWPALIAVCFVAFGLSDLQAGVSTRAIAWFIPGNTLEVLTAALGLRYCFHGVPRLSGVRALAKYSLFAVILAPLAGSFLSAHGIGPGYWASWRIAFFSEVLAFATVTPFLLSWITDGRALMRKSSAFHLEGLILITGLVLLSYVTFTSPQNQSSPALLFSLVPFLLWSALRFGWLGVSTSMIIVSCVSSWAALYGTGPFSHLMPFTNPVSLQLFLVFAAVPFMVLAALSDEREEAAHAVRESEARFRLVANTAPVMIWMSGTNRLCSYVNQPWLEFTGRPLEAELGNGWTEGVHKEDLQHCLETFSRAFDQRQSCALEYRLRRKDGEYRWILDTAVPRFNSNGSLAGYIGSCLDITDRKLAEGALASVGRRLIEAQEQERAWIGRELHDDIAQRIALLSVELGRRDDQDFGSMVEVHTFLQLVRQRIFELGKDIQALSHRLHSSKLEYLGLVTAAKGFCRELSEQSKVQIEFKDSDIPAAIPKEISVCLYRVLQEALQNAVKHSTDQNFRVELRGTKEGISLSVRDSGVGFDWHQAMNGRGLGLVSMRERLRLVSGELSIQSAPGRGTTVLASVLLKDEDRSLAVAG